MNTLTMKISHVLFLLLVFACSPVKVVSTKGSEDFKLSGYKTFNFYELDAKGDTTANFSPNVELLKEAIAKELQEKGLKQTNTNADMLINIGIVVREKVQTRETNYLDAPRYMGQRRYSWKSEEVEVGRYKTGSVTIEFVNPQSNVMVWQGIAESIIPSNRKNLKATIGVGVEKLFADLKKS